MPTKPPSSHASQSHIPRHEIYPCTIYSFLLSFPNRRVPQQVMEVNYSYSKKSEGKTLDLRIRNSRLCEWRLSILSNLHRSLLVTLLMALLLRVREDPGTGGPSECPKAWPVSKWLPLRSLPAAVPNAKVAGMMAVTTTVTGPKASTFLPLWNSERLVTTSVAGRK